MQATFPFDQRQAAQVVAVQPQQVKSIEDGLALAGHQFVELADAVAIEADDFAVQDSVLDGQFIERLLQVIEGLEVIQAAGDELALAGLDVGDRAEAVVLERTSSLRPDSPRIFVISFIPVALNASDKNVIAAQLWRPSQPLNTSCAI